MGGLGIVGDSIQLSLMNPASYSRLKLTHLQLVEQIHQPNKPQVLKAKSTKN